MSDAQRIFNEGLQALSRKDPHAAEKLFKRVLQSDPDHVPALNLLSIVLMNFGRAAEAEQFIAQAALIAPASDVTLYNYGLVLKSLNRYREALDQFSAAIRVRGDVPETWNNRGAIFNDLQQYEAALADFERAIALNSTYAEAYANKARSLVALARDDEALATYDKAITHKPDLAEAWIGRAEILYRREKFEDVMAALNRALSLKPNLEAAWLIRGKTFSRLKRHDDAVDAYEKALLLKPGLAQAWLGRGNALSSLLRYEEALAAYDKAISCEPASADLWYQRGQTLARLNMHREAIESFLKAQQLKPGINFLKGIILNERMLCCDWDGLQDQIREIAEDIDAGRLSAMPFGWQGLATSERSLQRCAELYNRHLYPATKSSSVCAESTARAAGDRICIGYLSGEFREHATAHLIVGLLEHHDKSKFRIICFDNGWDDGSHVRQRINRAVEKIVNIRQRQDSSVVEEIRREEVDVLVNLNGYFGEQRTSVFARRAAPVQVNYLGFPGTLGADYMDYIVADKWVIPDENRKFYDEEVVYLTNCYQANDRDRPIANPPADRAVYGIPAETFVFCCFNNPYKILPTTFDSWMRILNRVEGSILWLYDTNEIAQINLKKEAAKRGVDPERIIFAKYMPLPKHLARCRFSDLFLDTLPCNAHTTASDALWAGVPIVTQLGQTFAGRVAASLLNAIGLPELITRSADEYESLAVELALDERRLSLVREKLAANRLTTPLFDTEQFARDLESAYESMYRRHQKGLPPAHIDIRPAATAFRLS
jgi:predicted O-linked N-acetylglucosamine transferase (SPINDLY family)